MNPPSPRTALVVTVAVLSVYDVVRTAVIPDDAHLITNALMIGVLAAVAAWARLDAAQLGLARARVGDGLRWGLPIVAAIAAGTGLAAGLGRRSWFADTVDQPAADVWWRVFVDIPIGTVALEELAFRGVLLALCLQVFAGRAAWLVPAVLFGLWHVPGALDRLDLSGVAATLGVVAFTTAAGVGFQVLRQRSDSLVAPALAHWAANAVTLAMLFLFAR